MNGTNGTDATKLRICVFSKAMAAHRGGNFLWPFSIISGQLAGLGHDVTVLTTADPQDIDSNAERMERGARVIYLKDTKPEKTDKAWWQESARRFDSLHKDKPFDLVMGRGRSPHGFLTLSKHGNSVPLISHEGTYPSWLHGYKIRPSGLTAPFRKIHALFDALTHRAHTTCLTRSDLVVANSQPLADAMAECFWWNPPRACFIPYAFSPQEFTGEGSADSIPSELSQWLERGHKYLAYVGRVTRTKGAQDMVRILEACKDREMHLLLCGDANRSNRKRIETLAARDGLSDRIHMAGAVPHKALPLILSKAQAFLFPSTHPESLPKAVMEAMASGIPVLGYDIPAMTDLVRHGTDGFLVPASKADQLAACLNRLIDNEAERKAMGRAARDHIASQYDASRIARMWQETLAPYGKSALAATA